MNSTLPTRGLFLVLAFASALACKRSQTPGRESPAGAGPSAVPVVVAEVVASSMPVELGAMGRVEASSEVGITSQIAGRIERIHFREGDKVEKGALLFSIDARPYRAAVAQAQAQLLRDQALDAQAKNDAERAQNLTQAGVGSEQETERAKADAAALAASVAADEAALQNARLNLEYTTLRSPITGRTGSVLVHPGNLVRAASDAPLVVVRSLSPVFVRFAIPEQHLQEVRRRLGGSEALSVEATPRGAEAAVSRGRLSFIENHVDTTTGMVEVKAEFENADEALWPGQDMNVKLRLGTEANAVSVPEAAVRPGQSGAHVYVVNAESRTELRQVVVDRAQGDRLIVRSGVVPGERVVVDGLVRVGQGTLVKLETAPTDGPTTDARETDARETDARETDARETDAHKADGKKAGAQPGRP
jgi:membrane fusion protein, multidrug efflux system